MLKNKNNKQYRFALLIIFILFSSIVVNLSYAEEEKVVTHIISFGEKLNIRVLEQEDLSGVYLVASDGKIEFPLLPEPVKAQGLTYSELAADLKQKLEKENFYKVTIIVSAFKGQEFVRSTKSDNQPNIVYISGMVVNPGSLEFFKDEQLTVSKVIIKKGGFKEFANKRKVKLIRKSPVTGKAQTTILNMVKIIEKGKLEDDVAVKDGDLIVVPEQFFNF